MHILYFTPYFNQPRGNATTSKRIIHFLQKRGFITSVFPFLEKDPWNLPNPDVIHILHATRFAAWAADNNYIIRKPYVITMGGTDINLDLQTSLTSNVYDLLEGASFITVFTEDAKQKVHQLNRDWASKTVVIPQSVWVTWEIRKAKDYNSPQILLPAGLRAVKDVLHTLPALDELIHSYPGLTFTILGATLEQEVYEQVLKASADRPWLKYAGVVPFEVMTAWYNQANIVVNTSISEGQSLAVMEAMAMGRPVVARRNPANESLIQHQHTGWLYETMEQFQQAIISITHDEQLRETIIQNAKELVLRLYSPDEEANAYIHLYKKAGG